MNKDQFEIVKVMQKLGITPERFAKACGESVKKMRMAYQSLSHAEFSEAWFNTLSFLNPND